LIPTLIHFYGLSFAEVEELTLAQFYIMVDQIPKITKLFSPTIEGGGSGRSVDWGNVAKARAIATSKGLL